MKKLLLTAIAATALAANADAALKKGDVAPDFTLTDINGVSHNLYAYLDSGYTVVIDQSAAWCGPCWAVHQSGVLSNLVDQYGPNGTVQAKKIRVIFIEGESGNVTAQLYGTQGSGNAGYTQGDWVTGENYPFIDNPPAATASAYIDGGFPTFTVVGRDRIVYEQVAGYTPAMLQTTYWTNFTNNIIPNYAPTASGVDAKVVDRDQTGAPFYCQATPTIRFQNYSTTSNITSATLKVYSGATAVSTQTWTGSVAPMAVQDVVMPAFTQAGPYSFEVTVTGDVVSTNNTLANQTFAVMTAASASSVPYSENLESSTSFPSKMVPSSDIFFFYGGTGVTGANGSANSKVAVVDFFNNQSGTTGELIMSNFNIASATYPTFEFDVAYAQFSGSENDRIEVFVSKDCGVTWTSRWSKSGSTLATHTPVNTGEFVPSSASDWKHESVDLNADKDANLFIKFKATSGYGNFGFLDNFALKSNATSVNDVIGGNSVNLYPNPTHDIATLEFTSIKSSNVNIQVVDMTGRVAANVTNENFAAGTHKVSINTANLPSGIYNVKIQTEEGSRTERLTVVK